MNSVAIFIIYGCENTQVIKFEFIKIQSPVIVMGLFLYLKII